MEPIEHAKGSHIMKLNPAWDWVNRGKDPEEEVPPEPPPDPSIEDSWPVEKKNDDGSYGFYGQNIGCSMSFVAGVGGILTRAKVWMRQPITQGDPPQPITAHIYDTSKAAIDATPEGASLAASDPVDSSTLPAGSVTGPVEFFFTGANQLQLVKDKVYCLVFEIATPVLYDSYRFGFHHAVVPPRSDRNYSQTTDRIGWSSMIYFDPIFYVYNDL